VRVNGHDSDAGLDPLGYAVICRDWEEGDTVDLTLPMAVRAIQRPHGAIGVALGPLIFGLNIGEEWTRIPGSQGFGDWEVRPTTAWNYALAANPDRDPAAFRIERATVGTLPFAGEHPPVSLSCLGYRVPGWDLVQNSAGPVPEDPLPIDTSPVPITLIPYGCARLRIAEFPCVP
jgi:hypothetical protein